MSLICSAVQHFKSQLDLLFCLWDVDDNGTIDHEEMKNGIVKLGYDPAIQMSTDDWENFSLHRLLLNEDQELDRESFELAMRFQLADYSQVFLQIVMDCQPSSPLHCLLVCHGWQVW